MAASLRSSWLVVTIWGMLAGEFCAGEELDAEEGLPLLEVGDTAVVVWRGLGVGLRCDL